MSSSSPSSSQLIRGGAGAGKTSYLVQTGSEAITEAVLSGARVLALVLDRAGQRDLHQRFAVASSRAGRSVIPIIATYEDLAEQIIQESGAHSGRGIIRPLSERLLIGETIRQTASQSRYYRDERLRHSSRFRDDVADFIAELKRCKIDPILFRNQIIPGLPSPEALHDLADIYQEYQQRLQQAQVYDYRGIIWLALEALSDDHLSAGWQQRYDLVVADDLQDATLLQLELLAAICGPGTRLIAAYEPALAIYRFRGAVEDPAQLLQSLLPYPLALTSIDGSYPGRLSVQVAAVAQRFAQDQQLPATAEGETTPGGRTEVGVYRSLAEELVGIGDDIIQALHQPDVAPSQFAVIARRHAEAQAAAQHLALRGIPVAGYEGMVGHWSAMQILTDLISLLLYLREGDRYPSAIRQQKLAAANLALSHLAALTSAGGDGIELARICHQCTRQGRLMLATTGQVATPALQDWQTILSEALNLPAVAALRKIIAETGLIRSLAESGHENTLAGLARLLNTLQETEEAFAQVAGTSLELAQVRSAVEAAPESGPTKEEGVAVLTAHASRGREFHTVYLLGLTEGSCPGPALISRLLPQETVMALRQRGLRHLAISAPALAFAGFGEAPQEAYAEETRLFYTCLTRARQRVVLTCHLEKEGTDIAPSPFLAAALPPDFVLAPLPKQQQAGFQCVFAGLAPDVADGRLSHEGCPITPCAGRPPEQLPQPPPVEIRGDRPRPSRKPVLAEVASEWAASASSLNDYFRCPRLFFLGHLLRLGAEEHDAMVYGSAIHNFLAQLNALPPAERTPEGARALLDNALTKAHSALSSEYAFRVYQRRAQDSLEVYMESPYFAEPSAAQEHRFTVQLEDDEGQPHLFTGRIAQVTEKDGSVMVVDYKTGSIGSAASIRRSFCYRPDHDQTKEPPVDYQLPLYVLGWELDQGAVGQISQVALQSFQTSGGQGSKRARVELIAEGEPDDKQFTRPELEQIARHLAESARHIKSSKGFPGHPPAEGCNPQFKTCPFILICSEAELR